MDIYCALESPEQKDEAIQQRIALTEQIMQVGVYHLFQLSWCLVLSHTAF
jgi:hypothetical protein